MDITFKGTTFSSLGGVIEKMEWYKVPAKRKKRTYSPLVDGSIEVSDDGFDSISLNCDVVWTDPTKLDQIMALLTGAGVLIYSRDSSRYRIASIESEIDPEAIATAQKMTIPFYIEKPFRYVLSESNVTKTDFPATYVNAGTISCKPLLKLTGSGTVVIVVNGVTLTYEFDTAYVFIDCESQMAYFAEPDDKNRNIMITGDNWPNFSVGSNTISITSGTLTSIEITPRTRFI